MVRIENGLLVFSELEKGDYISGIHAETLTGMEQGSRSFAFALMGLRDDVADALLNLHGRRFTIKIEDTGLRILTDSEAADYNARQQQKSKERIFRAQRRNVDVDEANLSQDERSRHYRNLALGGAYTQALRKATREIGPDPHQRNSPGLVT
jgi:hypothetical protein